MEIKQFVWKNVDSNSWLVIENNHGLLIDAVDSEELFKAVESLESLTIILTHSHFDHIVGLNRIRQIKPDCQVISTKLCSEHIGNKFRNMSSSATVFMTFYKKGDQFVQIEPFECDPADKCYEKKTVFQWNNHSLELWPVYGHTNDGMIAMVDEMLLFTGDTLLHIPTITRFPTGNKELFISMDIPLLVGLKAQKIYPGHGDAGCKLDMVQQYL